MRHELKNLQNTKIIKGEENFKWFECTPSNPTPVERLAMTSLTFRTDNLSIKLTLGRN